MVRIITCHHFAGQKIGKCDQILNFTVADDFIVVALEHQVAIYSSEVPVEDVAFLRSSTGGVIRDMDDILGSHVGGVPSSVDNRSSPGSVLLEHSSSLHTTSSTTNNGPGNLSNELKFSHSFPTVDLIDFISYNRRGNYLLCLEKREYTPSQSGSNPASSSDQSEGKKLNRSIRIYFNWDSAMTGKPMKARIAGLVSPTGTEPDDETLQMVEIPQPTQPLTSTGPLNESSILAVASCNILGHLASLTDARVVNIYSFKLKEGKGRGRVKSQYADFDFSYTIELVGFTLPVSSQLDKCRLEFLANIIAVFSSSQSHVFRLTKHARTRAKSNDSSGSSAGSGSTGNGMIGGARGLINTITTTLGNNTNTLVPGGVSVVPGVCAEFSCADPCDKVIFDPKNESIKVYLNTITRANQKKKFVESTFGFLEEYQEEIAPTSRSRLVYSTSSQSLLIEDLLRVSIAADQMQSKFIVKVGLYPIRIKDDLGGVSCIVGTSTQAFVYHIPVVKTESIVSRVVMYPLTAPLVSFSFDSLFFHALTETGLETYTSRSLYYPIKEFEGMTRYVNECPFRDEAVSLVGLRPFIGVRHMAANELLVCLLASPKAHSGGGGGGVGISNSTDDNWTIYALQLPSIDMLHEDMSKAALQAKASNLETYGTLMTELHLVLRSYMNWNPEIESNYRSRYKETCKVIGIELFKQASLMFDDAVRLSDGTDKHRKEQAADELLDKGVTYLNMSGFELKSMFEEDVKIFVKDKRMNAGVTRFINVMLPKCATSDSSCQNTLSPKLAAAVTEYLLTHSPKSLVQLVINVPILRESNSAKLLPILKSMAEASNYQKDESLALLLILVTMTGCDQTTRSQVKEILKKCKATDLENSISLNWLIDQETNQPPPGWKAKIMDLTVCLSAANSSIPAHVVSNALKSSDITLGQVMMAFSQGINLNAETQVQKSLTRTLTTILEEYFVDKFKQLNISSNNTSQGIGSSNVTTNSGHRSSAVAKSGGMDTKAVTTSVDPPGSLTTTNTTTNNSQVKKLSGSYYPKNVQLNEDETRAVQALVRSYLSHINVHATTTTTTTTGHGTTGSGNGSGNSTALPQTENPVVKIETMQIAAGGSSNGKGRSSRASSIPQPTTTQQGQAPTGKTKEGKSHPHKGSASIVAENSSGKNGKNKTSQASDNHGSSVPASAGGVEGTSSSNTKNVLSEQNLTLFGKVPNFFSHIFKETYGLSTSTATSFQILSTLPVSEETREYFIKISSLLASPLGLAGGVRETILTFLDTKGQPGSTLHVCLQLMAEPSEKAIALLISKYPLAIMYYAKEMFGRTTSKWKVLVSKLKEKIKSNSEDADIYATIIESVYLYLANTLEVGELEEVLDKGEENSRFFKACRRTELANTYSGIVIQMSNEFLN